MTDQVVIAQKAPFAVELEAGKTYHWCSCGRSKSQPFCDGSHKGTSFEPVAFTAEKPKKPICAAAKKLPISLSAMARTRACNPC